jgi:type IV secretory pathway VirB2 component (pilin)
MIRKLNRSQRLQRLAAFALVSAPLAMHSAKAAVPAAYTDALDDLATDASTFVQAVFTTLASVLAISVLGALFFKGMKKGKAAI